MLPNKPEELNPCWIQSFRFLRRKTDFFEGPPGSSNSDDGTDAAIRKVHEVLNKHADIWRADQAKKKKQKTKPKQAKVVPTAAAAAAPANKADIAKEMEDIVELDADGGFDVSPAEKEVRKETPKPAPTVTKAVIDDTTKQVEPVVESTTEVSPDSQPDEKDDKSPPPLGNGGTVEGKYTWTQTLEELCVTVPLPEGTRGRDLVVSIAKKHLKVGLKSAAPVLILNGPLVKTIICDDSFLDGRRWQSISD
ncbi:hypothetical protein MHU86_10909 [Fragilaria crotonensis]|nr:hypothetical protein MHU86_10909 [Fragilaria crotonensis]